VKKASSQSSIQHQSNGDEQSHAQASGELGNRWKQYIQVTVSNKYPICSQYSGIEDCGNISQLEVGSVQSETTKCKLFGNRICNAKQVVEQNTKYRIPLNY
jgi:hypothetical protein